jgi:hypothetical protein
MHMLYLSQCSNHVTSSALEQVLFAIHMHAPCFIRLQRPDQNNTYIYISIEANQPIMCTIYTTFISIYIWSKRMYASMAKRLFSFVHT